MNSRSAGFAVLLLSVLAVGLFGELNAAWAQAPADTGSTQHPADGSAGSAAKPAEASPRLIDRINPFRGPFFGSAKAQSAPHVMNVELGRRAPVSELITGSIAPSTVAAKRNVDTPTLLNQVPLAAVNSRPQSDVGSHPLTSPAHSDVVPSVPIRSWMGGLAPFAATQNSVLSTALPRYVDAGATLPRRVEVSAAAPRRVQRSASLPRHDDMSAAPSRRDDVSTALPRHEDVSAVVVLQLDDTSAAQPSPNVTRSALPRREDVSAVVPKPEDLSAALLPTCDKASAALARGESDRRSPIVEEISNANAAGDLRHVRMQADQLTQEAVKLAAKGAVFSARVKLIQALELVASARDAQHNTQFHTTALAAGFIALREADDFGRADVTSSVGCDPVVQAAGHATPVIKFARQKSVTRLQALGLYYSYATTQLAASVGGVSEASAALFYLGRLQPFLSEDVDRPVLLAEPKALALQQAALVVDRTNYRAANELGVLFAACGQLESARKALLYGVSLTDRPEIARNLTIVDNRLGRKPEANAARDPQGARPSSQPTGRPMIYLVDHKAFADEGSGAQVAFAASTSVDPQRVPPTPASAPAPSATAPSQTAGTAEILSPLCWEIFAQGEYIGPARLAHVPEYTLRVDDQIGFVFRLNGKPTTTPYRLNVGDVIRIGSLTMTSLSLEAPIQPDGTIMLPQVGPVAAAGKNLESLRIELDQRYRAFLKEPGITVTPVAVNRTVQELIASINNRSGIFAGQAFNCRVSPDGTVQLPAIGSVPVQGFTLAELRNEIESRYAELVQGIDITPVLRDRAPRSVYVLGEVQKPGNYPLNNPTTVIQAIAQAGSWNIGEIGRASCRERV